ncbi:MAG: hypothetical protein REI94_10240 [Moraxellaceae bacterium]|nr:hypothetical protein [Moraxellaceae bacterium]
MPNPDKSSKKQPSSLRSYAPKGGSRINLSLLPVERADLERVAAADGRSLSAMARVLVLRAMSAQPVTASADAE